MLLPGCAGRPVEEIHMGNPNDWNQLIIAEFRAVVQVPADRSEGIQIISVNSGYIIAEEESGGLV